MKEVTEMKELTHEDWMKNPVPRMMWVWNDGEEELCIEDYVVYIASDEEMKAYSAQYRIKTIRFRYEHCAEIEEEETRLNNYELGQLLKCFGVEWKQKGSTFINDALYYRSGEEKEIPALEELKIRYKQGEWKEPTRETVVKWHEADQKVIDVTDIDRFLESIDWDKE